ncbi:hypothetical protein PR001_g18842 [Phytophthora rubi]|uniref:RxLR effector protein n=1 Tax=Phytophthora rubi TaxID=129364 RepID=A0A6A3K3P1_9STRA|nr:hypothetical protein PR001_g18842 [Phytophthora rubi]
MERSHQAIVVAVICACAGAIAVPPADGCSLGSARVNTSAFPSQTFEKAPHSPRTRWLETHLRCTKASFLLIYKAVNAAWSHKSRPNTKNPIIRRLALTMIYLAQGSSIYGAAAIMGI